MDCRGRAMHSLAISNRGIRADSFGTLLKKTHRIHYPALARNEATRQSKIKIAILNSGLPRKSDDFLAISNRDFQYISLCVVPI